jgi:hypothetical protein
MPMQRRLRKREVVLAVSAGALAAAAAAGILADGGGGPGPRPSIAGPDAMVYQVGEFQEIATVGPQDVVVTRGDPYSIRSEGSPEALALLEVAVEDGELVIRPKRRFGGNWGRLEGATFYVTVPRLERIAMAGSGDISIDRVESDSFLGDIAGSGQLAIADMKVDRADFSIGGQGNVSAAGIARETRVSIGGSGEVEAAGLRSEIARVSIGGVGDVELTVNDEADISIAGRGDVEITGPARCSVSKFGVGDVRCNGQDVD